MINDLDDWLHATENTWIRQWGVRDSYDHVTECASEQDAREYQATHGGELTISNCGGYGRA